LEKACKKVRKMDETDVVSNPAFALSRFYVPTLLPTYISPIFPTIGLDAIAFDPYEI
jgi:hypothetical protein